MTSLKGGTVNIAMPSERDKYWALDETYVGLCREALGPRNVTLEFGQSGALNQPAEQQELQIVDGVAVIPVLGVLRKYLTIWESLFGGGTRYATIIEQINIALASDHVRAIMLHIDSPGGSVAGGSEAVDAIYRARAHKPVIAYISDLGASAAYRLASQADYIMAGRDALVGSIGTYAVFPDFSGMYEENGVKIHVVKAGKFKGAGVPGTKITDEQLQQWQREADAMNDVFLDEIERGRAKLTRKQIDDLADGRTHVGKHALDVGLIDAVGAQADAIRHANKMKDQRVRQTLRNALFLKSIKAKPKSRMTRKRLR